MKSKVQIQGKQFIIYLMFKDQKFLKLHIAPGKTDLNRVYGLMRSGC